MGTIFVSKTCYMCRNPLEMYIDEEKGIGSTTCPWCNAAISHRLNDHDTTYTYPPEVPVEPDNGELRAFWQKTGLDPHKLKRNPFFMREFRKLFIRCEHAKTDFSDGNMNMVGNVVQLQRDMLELLTFFAK